MVKDIVKALIVTTVNRYSNLKCDSNWLAREMVIKDLKNILGYVESIQEDSKSPVAVVLSVENYKCEEYRKALNKVLNNLRLIDEPNLGDSYINASIDTIMKVVEEKSERK